jgi:Ni/Fe-hydrogenase subunit HybB-like protein
MPEIADRHGISPGWLADKLFMGQSFGEYLRSLVTPFNAVAALITAVGVPLIVYRFAYGLGATTNLSQTNAWGLWIGFDMLGGVALAAGGYTLATLVYILGLKRYYAVLRPAILTGFLGYLFAVIGLMVDLGRPWRLPYPIVYSWGVSSVMFEVSWCVLLYLTVLFLEFLPAALEWLGLRNARARAMKVTIGLVVFGVILSTLHQSSLGALFLMAPSKLHPLWYSPFIPVFFFVSSVIAGLSMVIVESALSHKLFRDLVDPASHVDLDRITIGLGRGAAVVLFAYFFLKLQGLVDSGRWDLLATPFGYWYLVEMLGFVLLPCVLFAVGARHANVRLIRATAAIAVVGVVLNRLNVSMIAMNWNAADRYVPHWMEVVTSVTIVTIGILTFRWIVNRMPILRPDAAFDSSH